MTLAPPDGEIWFLTGSQSLYGDQTLAQVADQSRAICDTLADQPSMTVRLVWKPVLTDAAAIRGVCLEANADDRYTRSAPLDLGRLSGCQIGDGNEIHRR